MGRAYRAHVLVPNWRRSAVDKCAQVRHVGYRSYTLGISGSNYSSSYIRRLTSTIKGIQAQCSGLASASSKGARRTCP